MQYMTRTGRWLMHRQVIGQLWLQQAVYGITPCVWLHEQPWHSYSTYIQEIVTIHHDISRLVVCWSFLTPGSELVGQPLVDSVHDNDGDELDNSTANGDNDVTNSWTTANVGHDSVDSSCNDQTIHKYSHSHSDHDTSLGEGGGITF